MCVKSLGNFTSWFVEGRLLTSKASVWFYLIFIMHRWQTLMSNSGGKDEVSSSEPLFRYEYGQWRSVYSPKSRVKTVLVATCVSGWCQLVSPVHIEV